MVTLSPCRQALRYILRTKGGVIPKSVTMQIAQNRGQDVQENREASCAFSEKCVFDVRY